MRAVKRCGKTWEPAISASFLLRIVVLSATLALWPAAPAVSRELQPGQQTGDATAEVLGRQELERLFDAVVDTVAENFWDKERLERIGWRRLAAEARDGVVGARDFDDAAARINTLLGAIGSSHTVLLTPDDVDYYVLLDVFGDGAAFRNLLAGRFWGSGPQVEGVGLFSTEIDGRHHVDAVLEGSPAARAGIRVGDEIIAVDGAPYHPVRSFRGKSGRSASITLRAQAGADPYTATVVVRAMAPLKAFEDATSASARIIERDGHRIGYIHVWASVGEAASRTLQQTLDRLTVRPDDDGRGRGRRRGRDGQPPDALIVDMRGRIGGTSENAGRYLDVIDRRGPVLEALGGSRAPGAGVLRGHTAVLIDRHTRSTAELFVHAYQRERQGPLIGARTAGAVSAARAFPMPADALLYLAVTGLRVDGEILEGVGVAPDIAVERPIAYAAGADPVLDAAVAHLADAMSKRPAPPGAPDGRHDRAP